MMFVIGVIVLVTLVATLLVTGGRPEDEED